MKKVNIFIYIFFIVQMFRNTSYIFLSEVLHNFSYWLS